MQLTSHTIKDGQAIPALNAMGVPAPGGAQPGPNRSPHLAWTNAPSGTQSFALLVVDRDAPTKADDVNKPGRTVPYDLARAGFVHWVLVDIPSSVSELKEGLDADGLTPRGKAAEQRPYGTRGLNDYTSWFKGDAQLEGVYAGYDGPWPPFNDERKHHYVFTLYALDVATVGLSGEFGITEAKKAIEGHVLAEASLTGWYTLYEAAR